MANALSASRILAVALIVVGAWYGAEKVVLGALAYALVSDAADGWVARRTGTVSEFGGRLDSIADALIYLTVPVVVWWLFPWFRERETGTAVVILLAYALPITYGFVKYRRLTSYHTLAAKAAGVAISTTFFLLLLTTVAWPLRLAAVLLVYSALEEMAITRTLPAWRANVRSLRAAREYMRSANK